MLWRKRSQLQGLPLPPGASLAGGAVPMAAPSLPASLPSPRPLCASAWPWGLSNSASK